MDLIFVTGNQSKFDEAFRTAKNLQINLIQKKADIRELQSNNVEEISLDKARQAFEIFRKPLFVNDSGWNIPSINGFPGSFMSYINEWFKPEDFIKLVEDKSNKEIILEELIVYIDSNKTKIFKQTRPGIILGKPVGLGRYASDSIVSFDGIHSIAEYYEKFHEPPKDNDSAYLDLFKYLLSN